MTIKSYRQTKLRDQCVLLQFYCKQKRRHFYIPKVYTYISTYDSAYVYIRNIIYKKKDVISYKFIYKLYMYMKIL